MKAKQVLVLCFALLATAVMALVANAATPATPATAEAVVAPPSGAAAVCAAASPLLITSPPAVVPLFNMNTCGSCSYSTCVYSVPGGRCSRNGQAGTCVAPGGVSCTQYPFLFCDCFLNG